MFTSNLSNFNHIELTPLDQKNNNWFQEACSQNIQCDVLVISGHFGGTFFSSKSEVRLSAIELEQHSCQKTCDGILKRPKEVYLFGCNTLAGKTKDRRTSSEYIQVLIADGFSPSEAQELAAIRYSPMGNSFNDKMTRIFSGVPKIYGFDSVGPSGGNIEGSLNKYFKDLGSYDQHFEKVSAGKDNAIWTKNMTAYAYAQTSGALAEKASKSFACTIVNKALPNRSKLLALQRIFKDEKSILENIEYLDEYMKNQYMYSSENKSRAIVELESMLKYELMIDENAKKIVQKYTKKELPGLLSFQIALLNVSKELGWINNNEYDQKVSELFGDFRSGISIEQGDTICSRNIRIPGLTINNFKKGRWGSGELRAIGCLDVYDSKVADKIINEFLKRKAPLTEETFFALLALSKTPIKEDKSRARFATFVSAQIVEKNNENFDYLYTLAIKILAKNQIACESCRPLMVSFKSNCTFLKQPITDPNTMNMVSGCLSTIDYELSLDIDVNSNLDIAVAHILNEFNGSDRHDLRLSIQQNTHLCSHLGYIQNLEKKYLPSDKSGWSKTEKTSSGYSTVIGDHSITKNDMLLSDDLAYICKSQKIPTH